MPQIALETINVEYSLDSSAGEDRPVLVLSNSLGTTMSMWDSQITALTAKYRVLRYNTRGHGQSSKPSGAYTIAQLGQDVIELMNALNIPRAYFCGLSMGGMIGTYLAINAQERFEKIILCNTNAFTAQPDFWDKRISILHAEGVAAIADGVMARFFSPAFTASSPQIVADFKASLVATPVDGYASCCAAIRDMDFRGQLQNIRVPTLVIAGTKDEASPPENGQYLAKQIPNAKYKEIGAAHISNIEAPAEFSDAVISFLQ
ncbi:MAG: 3-oxoadipate enol-lactonase [Burkholderiaceae bacterium]|nr:3-oxoadipate enol-lactonase [Burkholderiaceae bacterium]